MTSAWSRQSSNRSIEISSVLQLSCPSLCASLAARGRARPISRREDQPSGLSNSHKGCKAGDAKKVQAPSHVACPGCSGKWRRKPWMRCRLCRTHWLQEPCGASASTRHCCLCRLWTYLLAEGPRTKPEDLRTEFASHRVRHIRPRQQIFLQRLTLNAHATASRILARKMLVF